MAQQHRSSGQDGTRASAETGTDTGVVVGWSHRVFSRGIDLQLQRQLLGAAGTEIDSANFLMTPNQALILAQYLLDATGQELPRRRRRDAIGRLLRLRRRAAVSARA